MTVREQVTELFPYLQEPPFIIARPEAAQVLLRTAGEMLSGGMIVTAPVIEVADWAWPAGVFAAGRFHDSLYLYTSHDWEDEDGEWVEEPAARTEQTRTWAHPLVEAG